MKLIMFKYIILLAILFTLNSCNKDDINITHSLSFSQQVIQELKDSLSVNDFNKLDSTRTVVYKLSSGNSLLQILTSDPQRFIIVEADINSRIVKGKILQFDTTNLVIATNNANSYNGSICIFALDGHQETKSIIKNNYLVNYESNDLINNYYRNSDIKSYSILENKKTFDNSPYTLPDAIVFSSLNGKNNLTNSYYFNLFNILGSNFYQNQYLPIEPNEFGIYGSLYNVNFINDKKEAIDIISLINCFGTISDEGAKYSISVASLLPVDNHPEEFLNLTERSAGHAFISLTKENASGQSITQVIGFYPVVTDVNTMLGEVNSKIVNDEENKYSAIYSLDVNANQFRSAITKAISLSHNNYNLYNFNCTNFAINVFNAAGGNIYIEPQYYMPYAMTPFISISPIITPNALYRSIEKMQQSGNNNAILNTSKAKKSHGPC